MPVATRYRETQSKIGFRSRKRRSCASKPTKALSSPTKVASENVLGLAQESEKLGPVSSPLRCLQPRKDSSPMTSRNGNQSPRLLIEKPSFGNDVATSPRKRLFEDAKDNLETESHSEKENHASRHLRKETCNASPVKQKRVEGFHDQTENSSGKKTPRSRLVLDKQDGLSYGKIRQQLHTSVPDRMLCREKETSSIFKFLSTHIRDRNPGSLYISGAPGTGKTVCLTKVIETIKQKTTTKFRTVWINCMSLKQSLNVYHKIACEISGKEIKGKESEKYLENVFCSPGSMIVLVLDEIDQLESKNQEILYNMFGWASRSDSRLVLVGIANALDLTDRVLPRLQIKARCQPELLQFTPYTRIQIAEILDDRLKEVNNGIVDTSTVQFCARKVASVAGDMRKALDIMRRSVEVVETETKKQQVLKVVTNSPCKEKSANFEIKNKVTLSHIAKVVSEVYGAGLTSGKTSCKESLPLQQKVLICTLLLLLKKEKAKETTFAKLHKIYCLICKNRQLSIIHQEEFVSLCQLVEARGIISIKQTKDIRTAKVCLRLQESDVEHALQDKILLSSILEGGIPK